MIDIKKAEGFVAAHGDMVEQARLAKILHHQNPDDTIRRRLADMQNPDGGYAYWLPGETISTVCDTAYVLWWFDDLGIRTGTTVDRAVEYLFAHQKSDGGWDEVDALKTMDVPEFLIPGETRTRVWLTAYCAHLLMLFGHADSPQCRGCPVDFLIANREPSGKLIGYLRATWDALAVFSRYPAGDRKPFKRALAVIENELTPGKWAASYLAWLVRALRDAGLARDHPVVSRCLAVLTESQRPDGSWKSEDDEKYAPGATIEVIRVLKDYGVI